MVGHATLVRPGAQIGRYKLLEQIGEGGMGTVWVAEQIEPVRRRVALKLVKPGMDSRQVLSRFDAERQALALMDHPNIARVLDGGITDEGRPFFVMEYVKGIAITRFCDDARFTINQRLQLFIQVCHAVQHAHQKGIIHRDLKPSNILVCLYDGRPIPKIIDFGLAKAMHQPLTEHTLYTAHGLMVGTPLYMSPEQAEFNNLDVDTRTDIYSLGVILYELLTGSTPLERQQLKNAAAEEILRLIKEEDPLRPSTKITGSGSLASIAAQRSLEPAQLSRLVRGDLDWIAMTCLEKDRSRRYETASALARDLQRYIDDEPVEACPPSLGYKVRKLARRNRRAIATTFLVGLALVAAITVTAGSVGWAVRDRQTRQAVVERNILSALDEAALATEQERIADADAAVRQAAGLLESIDPSPAIRHQVYHWQRGLEMIRKLEAIEIQKPALGFEPADRSAIGEAYAKAFREHEFDLDRPDHTDAAERIDESPIKKHLLAALDDWAVIQHESETTGDLERPDLNHTRLFALARAADRDPWRNKLRDAFEKSDFNSLRHIASADDLVNQHATTAVNLARKLHQGAEHALAIKVLRTAHRRHPNNLWINFYLGTYLIPVDPYKSVSYFRTCHSQRPNSASIRTLMGAALQESEYPAEAEVEWREAIRLNPNYALPHSYLGRLLQPGKPAEAEDHLRHAIRLNPNESAAFETLKNLLVAQNRIADAEVAFRTTIQNHPKSLAAYAALMDVLDSQGRWEEWKKLHQEVLVLSTTSWEIRKVIMTNLLGRDANRAELASDELVQIVQAIPTDHLFAMQTAILQYRLGKRLQYDQVCRQLLERAQDPDDVRHAFRIARACLIGVPPHGDLQALTQLADMAVASDSYDFLHDHFRLVRALAAYRAGDWAGTIKWCGDAKAYTRSKIIACALAIEAMAHHHTGDHEKAIASLASARESIHKAYPDAPRNLGSTWVDWLFYEILSQEAERLLAQAAHDASVGPAISK